MSTRPEDWPRVRETFEAALAVPASERRAHVAAACGADGALLSAVEELLASHDRAGQFLETPATATITEVEAVPRTENLEGRRIGPYRVVAQIGAGGMGEVYRARDLKLDRDVAIKILPVVFRSDSERLARFAREARILAALNHPHIAAIYGLEESDSAQVLVLELVEGATLAELIARGPMPLDEALGIARQIAEALEAAHEKGIIHRDLKPANATVTPDGIVKVLDFGLAKVWEAAAGGEVSAAPTLTAIESVGPRLLGSPPYMSPEQARGRPLDKRTDIWSFGCVLFEMLAGRAPFAGETFSDTLAHILERDVEWEALPPSTPARVRNLLRSCLQKDASRRLRDIGDARLEIDHALAERASGAGVLDASGRIARQPSTGAARLRRLLWVCTPALIAAVATGVVTWTFSSGVRLGESRVVRLTVALDGQLGEVTGGAIALSPDGSQLAYVGNQAAGPPLLYVRRLDSLAARPLAGTESAMSPFFSPDGEWLGFFANGNLKKVAVSGGIPQTLGAGPAGKGGSWGSDGTIYFAPSNGSGIWSVSALGGAAQEITRLDRSKGDVSHRWPQVLEGGRSLLFTVWTGPGVDERHLELLQLGNGERTPLVQGASTGRYVPSGHIVYSRGGALMAVPFDLSRRAVTGPPTALGDHAREQREGALYAFSESGSLAFVSGSAQWESEHRLVWVDLEGNVEPLPVPLRAYENPRISADGRHAVVSIHGDTFRIWIYDFLRATLTPLTSGASSQIPVWTPDGTRIVYRGTRSGFRNLLWKPVDGSVEERLTMNESLQSPVSFSPDGKWLAFYELDPSTGYDIWVLPVNGDRRPRVFLRTPFNESIPQVSPDGRWLAYMSDESGRREIFVQQFPDPGRKSLVSTDGGNEPVWSPDGRRLFYVSGDKMMAVDVTTQPTFAAGSPRVLYEGRFRSGWELSATTGYDVSPDGRRFLRVQSVRPDEAPRHIHVVINWFAELDRRLGQNP